MKIINRKLVDRYINKETGKIVNIHKGNKKITNRSLCPICDEWYPNTESKRHDHPEPQRGCFRDAWLDSSMKYEDWIINTPEGIAWDKGELKKK